MPSHPKLQVYKSRKNGQHYWRLKSRNGKKIATGNEGFHNPPGPEYIDMLIRTLKAAKYERIKSKNK